MTDWIKCEDELPPEDNVVFVFNANEEIRHSLSVAFRRNGHWYACADADLLDVEYFDYVKFTMFTHWRPMVEMPSD